MRGANLRPMFNPLAVTASNQSIAGPSFVITSTFPLVPLGPLPLSKSELQGPVKHSKSIILAEAWLHRLLISTEYSSIYLLALAQSIESSILEKGD